MTNPADLAAAAAAEQAAWDLYRGRKDADPAVRAAWHEALKELEQAQRAAGVEP